MKQIVSTFYHIAIYVVYTYSLAYDVINVDLGGKLWQNYGGRFKYLTFLNLILQTVYFGLCVANDLCGSNVRPSQKGQTRSRLQRWRDYLLATLVFPLGMFVVLSFWGIYAIDRELVYPKSLDAIIPSWLNHVMHTTILPFLLLDISLNYHQYPSRKSGIITLLSFALFYLLWILWIAYKANLWVYPILKVLAPHQKAAFIALMMVVFLFIYVLGEQLNKMIWGKERSHLVAKKTR